MSTQTMGNHAQHPAIQGQTQETPILYFVATYEGNCQCIAAYSAESARQKAIERLGGISDFYQTFPIDVDYSDFPDIQAQKLAALGGHLANTLQEQAWQRGLEPMPLETGLLLKRIAQGGHSGQFLADAFISAYRTRVAFLHSLGELHKLDAEAFRLFHQILHIRHVSGWSDEGLYQIEQRIMALVGGV